MLRQYLLHKYYYYCIRLELRKFLIVGKIKIRLVVFYGCLFNRFATNVCTNLLPSLRSLKSAEKENACLKARAITRVLNKQVGLLFKHNSAVCANHLPLFEY